MKAKALWVLIISEGLVGAAPARPGSTPAEPGAERRPLTPAYLNELAEELRQNHPALAAARERTNAAAAAVGGVRTWEDPLARIGGMAASERMRAEEGDLIYGIEQKLPLFGKPRLARQAAQAGLATASAELQYREQVLRRELAKQAFRTALADEVLRIGREDLGWLEVMVAAVEARYRSGQATLVDVLQLQNERSRRATQLETDRELLAQERVALNRLLNRALDSSWPTLELPPVAGPVPYGQKLVDLALKFEPRLRVLQRETGEAEAALELTRRQRLPEVSAGLEARNYTGDGSFRQGMVVLSVNLPWFNRGKYRRDIQREEARVAAARHEREDYELALREELHGLTVRIDAARREALSYQSEIIPRSQTALASARAGWESGRNTLRDLLDARRMLLEARLGESRARAEQYQQLSDLVLCCGLGDLEALEMLRVLPSDRSSQTSTSTQP